MKKEIPALIRNGNGALERASVILSDYTMRVVTTTEVKGWGDQYDHPEAIEVILWPAYIPITHPLTGCEGDAVIHPRYLPC